LKKKLDELKPSDPVVGSTSVFLKAFSFASVPSSSAPIKYDFMRDVGHKHIGTWLDRAAQRAGR